MDCENTYCVYQKNGRCRLDRITIDCIGQCVNCVKLFTDDDKLESEKESFFNKLTNINI